MTRRTLARPSAWLFAVLVVYASLYPFEGWRAQGAHPLAFLVAPPPRYWLRFDVFSNLVGYAHWGFCSPSRRCVRAGAVGLWWGRLCGRPCCHFLWRHCRGICPAGCRPTRTRHSTPWAARWGQLLLWVCRRWVGWPVGSACAPAGLHPMPTGHCCWVHCGHLRCSTPLLCHLGWARCGLLWTLRWRCGLPTPRWRPGGPCPALR